ncbi:MAG: histidine kinase, partial [bacterium]|nr:histidine kinase [bacterium]
MQSKTRTSSVKWLDAITKISKTITSDLYLEDILRLIVTVTAEVMGSKICSLMLLDEDKNTIIIKATQSVSQDYNKKPSVVTKSNVIFNYYEKCYI